MNLVNALAGHDYSPSLAELPAQCQLVAHKTHNCKLFAIVMKSWCSLAL